MRIRPEISTSAIAERAHFITLSLKKLLVIPRASRRSLGLCRKLCSSSMGSSGRHYRHQSRAVPTDEERIPRIVDQFSSRHRDHASPPGDPIPPPTSHPLLGGPPDWTVQREQRECRRPGRSRMSCRTPRCPAHGTSKVNRQLSNRHPNRLVHVHQLATNLEVTLRVRRHVVRQRCGLRVDHRDGER